MRKSFEKLHNLIFYKLSPGSCYSFVSRILGQNGVEFSGFINVLNNNKRHTDGISIMEEDWDFLMDWICVEKERALVDNVFFHRDIFYSFLLQSQFNPFSKRAEPGSQQLHSSLSCHAFLSLLLPLLVLTLSN